MMRLPAACLFLLFSADLTGAQVDGASKRISELKCEEYLEQTTRRLSFVPLTAVSRPISIKVSDCEVSNVHLIVGGTEAQPGEFPHMAALGYGGNGYSGDSDYEWLCGGTLISERYVLTAAHCISHDRFGSPRVVRLGEQDFSSDDDGASPEDYRVAKVILHPDYRPPQKYHDIALLKLSRDVSFSQKIRPACLTANPPPPGAKTVATGWGRIQYADEQSPKLLKVVVPVVDEERCSELWASTVRASNRSLPRGIDPDVMLCAGDLEGGKDTCLGDSGGPLSVRSENNTCVTYVVGITSFGRFCGFKNSPGVYARVAHYLSWIERAVWILKL